MCHPAWSRARTTAQHLTDLARLRRVRDRLDREYAQPLNIEVLARDARIPPGELNRQFHVAYGQSPYAYVMRRRTEQAKNHAPRQTTHSQTTHSQTTHRPVRNQEAQSPTPELA
ncbi:hypothetical protein E2651_18755 [Streptomyces sp. MZ04]|nr:hypothetical protein E2651_18755 [Streptomyces sp. MZ04]